MRYLYCLLLCAVLLLPSLALAGNVNTRETSSTPTAGTSDVVVYTGPAFVKFMTCMPTDNASTADTITLNDATAGGGAGTVKVDWSVLAIDYSVSAPKVFPVFANFVNGIVINFTSGSDMKCAVSYIP